VRPPDAAIPSAVGLQRSGDWPAARRSDQCVAPPANHRCAVGLMQLLREEFRLLKLILHSELRPRAASRRALPCPSSCIIASYNSYPFVTYMITSWHCHPQLYLFIFIARMQGGGWGGLKGYKDPRQPKIYQNVHICLQNLYHAIIVGPRQYSSVQHVWLSIIITSVVCLL